VRSLGVLGDGQYGSRIGLTPVFQPERVDYTAKCASTHLYGGAGNLRCFSDRGDVRVSVEAFRQDSSRIGGVCDGGEESALYCGDRSAFLSVDRSTIVVRMMFVKLHFDAVAPATDKLYAAISKHG